MISNYIQGYVGVGLFGLAVQMLGWALFCLCHLTNTNSIFIVS